MWVWYLCIVCVLLCLSYPSIHLSKKARAVSTSAYKCFAAADEEWEECDSVMWTITSDYLQRGLKSCLAQISSQTWNQIFLRGRAASPWVSVAARMWIMAVLMWLHASVQITSCTFHKIMVRFASSGLLPPVLNIVLPTWNKFSWGKRNVGLCTFVQQVQLSHTSRCFCVYMYVFAQTELAEPFLVFEISPTYPTCVPTLTLRCNRQQEGFGVAETSRSSKIWWGEKKSLPVSSSKSEESRQILSC